MCYKYLWGQKICSSINMFAGSDRNVSYSTLSLIRVLSFMVAVRAKPLVAGDDMWDCRTVSKASRTSSSLTWWERRSRDFHRVWKLPSHVCDAETRFKNNIFCCSCSWWFITFPVGLRHRLSSFIFDSGLTGQRIHLVCLVYITEEKILE